MINKNQKANFSTKDIISYSLILLTALSAISLYLVDKYVNKLQVLVPFYFWGAVAAALILSLSLVISFLFFNILIKKYEEAQKRVEIDGCRECSRELISIQKRIFGNEVEQIIDLITSEDLFRISSFINALSTEEMPLDQEAIAKTQKLISLLIAYRAKGQPSTYITLEDIAKIESNVNSNSTIEIYTSSLNCDNNLQNVIVTNLKRGVKYCYYLSGNSTDQLISTFRKNYKYWKSKAGTSRISKQVKCFVFSPELMQMTIMIYESNRFVEVSYDTPNDSPNIVVKFPYVDNTVIKNYPLFFNVYNTPALVAMFKAKADTIKNHANTTQIEL